MIRAAFAAAKALKRDFGEVEQLQVSEKGPGDFVSRADIMAERTLRKELERTRPDYGFLGEEGGEIKGDGRNRWIVDPLDGTTNFLHGVPHFAISLALERDGEIDRRRDLPADLRRAVLGREGQRRLHRHAQRPLAPPARLGPQGAGARADRHRHPAYRQGRPSGLCAQARGSDGQDRRRAPLGRRRARPRLRRGRPLRRLLRVSASRRGTSPPASCWCARRAAWSSDIGGARPTCWAARRSSPPTPACATPWSRSWPSAARLLLLQHVEQHQAHRLGAGADAGLGHRRELRRMVARHRLAGRRRLRADPLGSRPPMPK